MFFSLNFRKIMSLFIFFFIISIITPMNMQTIFGSGFFFVTFEIKNTVRISPKKCKHHRSSSLCFGEFNTLGMLNIGLDGVSTFMAAWNPRHLFF